MIALVLLILLLKAFKLFEALVVHSDFFLLDLVCFLVAEADPNSLGLNEVAVLIAVLVEYATYAILRLDHATLVVVRLVSLVASAIVGVAVFLHLQFFLTEEAVDVLARIRCNTR